MVPADAVADSSADAVARQHIAAGEVDRRPRRLTHRRAAVVDPRRLACRRRRRAGGVGRRRRATPSSVATGGVVVAADGVVVGVVGEALLVAVPADEAPQVAQAASTGDVAVLIQP